MAHAKTTKGTRSGYQNNKNQNRYNGRSRGRSSRTKRSLHQKRPTILSDLNTLRAARAKALSTLSAIRPKLPRLKFSPVMTALDMATDFAQGGSPRRNSQNKYVNLTSPSIAIGSQKSIRPKRSAATGLHSKQAKLRPSWHVCLKRAIRKEIIHAIGAAGSGNKPPKYVPESKISC